jgi:hypothetical protein
VRSPHTKAVWRQPISAAAYPLAHRPRLCLLGGTVQEDKRTVSGPPVLSCWFGRPCASSRGFPLITYIRHAPSPPFVSTATYPSRPPSPTYPSANEIRGRWRPT